MRAYRALNLEVLEHLYSRICHRFDGAAQQRELNSEPRVLVWYLVHFVVSIVRRRLRGKADFDLVSNAAASLPGAQLRCLGGGGGA
jgi:hypothetical protein